MKYMKATGGIAAIALVVIGIGVALAAAGFVPTSAVGVHRLTLTSTTQSDSGVGFYTMTAFSSTDSIVKDAVFLMRGKFSDTILAQAGVVGDSGIPKRLTGSVVAATGIGTFFAQTSDTAGRATASIDYSSATNGSGTWSSTFTGASSQVDSSTFFASTDLSTKILIFGDSSIAAGAPAGDTFQFGDSLAMSGDSISFAGNPFDTIVSVSIKGAGDANVGDTMRLIVEGPDGRIILDTQMKRVTEDTNAATALPQPDTRFFSPLVHFDTGTSKIYIIFWDAAAKKYAFKVGTVTVGATSSAVTPGSTVTADTMGAIRSVAVTNSSASVTRITISDVANDSGPRSNDAFAATDSNTSGFDTRLPFSVFRIDLFDASGNRVFVLPTGQTQLVVVNFNFSGLSSSTASAIKLLRLNDATNKWENVASSTSDSTNSRIVSSVSSFSLFSLGSISTGGSSSAASNGNCVINNALGHTSLSGVMPSLRNVRDNVLSSSIGRLLVTGYYGFAGTIALLIAAGFGLTTLAGKRR